MPGGAPHLVVNLTDTVAFAGNFLDDSNLDAAMADIREMVAVEADEKGAMAGAWARAPLKSIARRFPSGLGGARACATLIHKNLVFESHGKRCEIHLGFHGPITVDFGQPSANRIAVPGDDL